MEHPRNGLGGVRPSVHVLVPYAVEAGALVSPEYDTPEFRAEISSWFEPLGLDWRWRETTLAGLDALVAELRAEAARGPVVAVNLCDGFDIDGYPGPSLIDKLVAARIPVTGGQSRFYRLTCDKLEMKARFVAAGLPTAAYHEIVDPDRDVPAAARHVGFPAIVKLARSAAGGGLSRTSVVGSEADLAARVAVLDDEGLAELRIYAERFLAGREATVLVRETRSRAEGVASLPAVEMVYHPRVPVKERILFEGHRKLDPDGRPRGEDGVARCTYEAAPDELQGALRDAAEAVFRAVGGDGYARVDLRIDPQTGLVNVLEVNTNPELSRVAPTIAPALTAAGLSFEALIEDLLATALARASEPSGEA
jgi:D-alanine-D-alanine ligase-like ATP-grasp enzyme